MQHGLPWKHGSTTDIQQLTRLTLATEDSTAAAQAFTGVQTAAATYDLVAIRPLSDRVMQQVRCPKPAMTAAGFIPGLCPML